MTKIGFVTTAHYSEELRPNGIEYLNSYLNSISENCEVDYNIYVMDNESVIPFDDESQYFYERFENQRSGGLSKTWNVGVERAYNDGCEVIVVSNDDIVFTETINDLFNYIRSNNDAKNCHVGPVCNNAITYHQQANGPGTAVIDYTNTPWDTRPGFPLNGYCFAFHRDFYKNFNVEGKLWNIDGTKPKWGGEENDLFDRCHPLGMRSVVYQPWFVGHYGDHGWRQHLDMKGNLV